MITQPWTWVSVSCAGPLVGAAAGAPVYSPGSVPVLLGSYTLQHHHRIIVWIGRDLQDHSVPTPHHGKTPPTRSGCPGLHPTWLKMSRGMGHPQLFRAACAKALPPSVKNCFIPNLKLASSRLKPLSHVLSLHSGIRSLSCFSCWPPLDTARLQ